MDNIPVDHGLPPLIHTLTTLHRERQEVGQIACGATTGISFKDTKNADICRPGLVKMGLPTYQNCPGNSRCDSRLSSTIARD